MTYYDQMRAATEKLKTGAQEKLLSLVSQFDDHFVTLPYDMEGKIPVVVFNHHGHDFFAVRIDADSRTVDTVGARFMLPREAWVKDGTTTTSIPLSKLPLWTVAHLVDTVQAITDTSN